MRPPSGPANHALAAGEQTNTQANGPPRREQEQQHSMVGVKCRSREETRSHPLWDASMPSTQLRTAQLKVPELFQDTGHQTSGRKKEKRVTCHQDSDNQGHKHWHSGERRAVRDYKGTWERGGTEYRGYDRTKCDWGSDSEAESSVLVSSLMTSSVLIYFI